MSTFKPTLLRWFRARNLIFLTTYCHFYSCWTKISSYHQLVTNNCRYYLNKITFTVLIYTSCVQKGIKTEVVFTKKKVNNYWIVFFLLFFFFFVFCFLFFCFFLFFVFFFSRTLLFTYSALIPSSFLLWNFLFPYCFNSNVPNVFKYLRPEMNFQVKNKLPHGNKSCVEGLYSIFTILCFAKW